MLRRLTIRNYALIRELELEPSNNLSVITGETGAGKSIMLGALGLLLGTRADTKVLWNEEEKCITEGVFDIQEYRLRKLFEEEDLDYQDQTVLRREISPQGKSRAFINDTPVTLDVMRRMASRLMDIHSQHETLDLGEQRFQLSLCDAWAGHDALLSRYQLAWSDLKKCRREWEALQEEARALQQEADFIRFQLEELQKAVLEPGEYEKLEEDLRISEHAEDIKSRLNNLLQLLQQSDFSAVHALSEARLTLAPIANLGATYGQLATRLESVRVELVDIVSEIESAEEQIEFDPARNLQMTERLDLLNRLLRKYNARTVQELLEQQEALAVKADKTHHLDELLNAAEAKLGSVTALVQQLATELTENRRKTFNPITRKVTALLQELGIPDVVLQFKHEIQSPGPAGQDVVELMFSANKGSAPKPLEDAASGGEFSRLMFAVKYVLAEKTALPTLVLDEIDSGVSGEIAIRMGKMMREMARSHQVIAISHLPQVAAKADRHFFVYKDNSSKRTVSMIRSLNEVERVEEIAKMIGGEKPTRMAMENARELMG